MMSRALQMVAGVRPAPGEDVRYGTVASSGETLLPGDTACHDGVLVPSPWNGNWFVGVQGGAGAFLGKPLGCADLFDRMKPEISVTLGKWFTPQIGARAGYGGWRFKDCGMDTKDYHHFHADLMWNVLGGRYAKAENPRWGIVPYVGLGVICGTSDKRYPFALSYGLQGQCRISKRLTALLEVGNLTTFQDFDGYGNASRLGDNMLSLSAGLSLTLGKVGWRRAVDAAPYIRQNDRLLAYCESLSEGNRRYAARHDRDRRILAELKKILEIEGILERYGDMFDSGETEGDNYPKNDYSGLNSLRTRLKYRIWDGSSPLADGQSGPMSEMSDTLMAGNGGVMPRHSGNSADAGDVPKDSVALCKNQDYLALISSGDGCVGSPIYFFFELGSDRLTDASQLVNLDELAWVAKEYGLSVSVTGAADSATGDTDINGALSLSRADYIVSELGKRGLDMENITKTGRGGISDFNPTEANRHTKVMLFIK